MAYTAEISRSTPTAFLFLVDQSGSMDEAFSSGRTKAHQVADVLNRTLANLCIRCQRGSDGVRDYFHVGVLGYGGTGIQNGFKGDLAQSILHPISHIEAHPLRIDERSKKTDDGAGGILEQTVRFPIWFEPQSSGGTPMCQAITRAAEELAAWCDEYPACYPPTVLHITDGESTDGDPESLAAQMRLLETQDGNALLMNLHISSSGGETIQYPSDEAMLPNSYAKMLFRMSSFLPQHLVTFASNTGLTVSSESRGFMYNADAIQIVEFFDIGTRPAQMR